jgi:DinB superfamily
MSDQALLMLVTDVRGKTLRLLEGVNDQMAKWAPPGLNNSILWHAGHSFVVNEALGIGTITGKDPVYPDGWFDKFSWASNPATVTQWPSLSEVVDRLKEQQQRLTSGVEGMPSEKLSAIVGDPAKGRTARWRILHGLHDEAGHQGEIWLLRKLQEKGKK